MSNPLDCSSSCCPTTTTTDIPGVQGQSAFTTTTASFVVPVIGNTVSISVANNTWAGIGEPIFIVGAGMFEVTNLTGSTGMTLLYLNASINTNAGATIASGALVTPGGTAADGTNGTNAFTVTTANFTVPAVSATVSITVGDSTWMAIGQNVFVQTAGYFSVASKADGQHFVGTYLNVAFNTFTGNVINAGAEVSPAGPELANPLTIALGGTGATTATNARADLGVGGASLTAYSSGTAYSLTAVSAALAFGTTSPNIVITSVGTWLLLARVRVDYNAATFAAVRTGTMKLRRTNNTAADLTNGSTGFKTDVITTLTYTLDTMNLPPVIYVTTNTNDAISIFGDISVVPTAGSLDAVAAEIIAIKLFDQTV